MENKNSKDWRENLRLITPFMLIILSFVGWTINMRIEKVDERICLIDEKLFKHLTNDDIHTPRNLVVSQEAFTIYQTMRDKEMIDIKGGINEIKEMLKLKKDTR